MAKLITDDKGVTHLRHSGGGILCGTSIHAQTVAGESEGTLTCPACAKIALHAVELVTKAEKREWRKL